MDEGEGRNPVVAGVSFSWEEQRDLVSTPAEVSNMRCSWAQRPGQDTALAAAAVVWPLEFKTENKAMEACHP